MEITDVKVIPVDDEKLKAFVDAGPRMLRFVEENSPVRFSLGNDTDYHPELPGGKTQSGRKCVMG